MKMNVIVTGASGMVGEGVMHKCPCLDVSGPACSFPEVCNNPERNWTRYDQFCR